MMNKKLLNWKRFLNRAFNPFYEDKSRWVTPRQFLRNAFWPFEERVER